MSKYIITGNLSAPQNITSTVSWLREYGSLLRESDPGMTLTLAGKDPSPSVLEAAAKAGARVIASPRDMSVYLKESDIYICPADNGSGIKLRVMDGLKSGLPVVAHKLASRGYEPCIGRSLFVYEDEKSFLEAVRAARALHCDRAELISEYRKMFSFQAGVERMRQVLQNDSLK